MYHSILYTHAFIWNLPLFVLTWSNWSWSAILHREFWPPVWSTTVPSQVHETGTRDSRPLFNPFFSVTAVTISETILRASLGSLAGSWAHKWPRTEATDALCRSQTPSSVRRIFPALFLLSLCFFRLEDRVSLSSPRACCRGGSWLWTCCFKSTMVFSRNRRWLYLGNSRHLEGSQWWRNSHW